jgi:hypothetical protein
MNDVQLVNLPSVWPRPNRELRVPLLATVLTHRVAAHLNAMRIVNQPIQDAIRQRGISNLFMPA